MATAKQIAANRRNAQRSTGPRTTAGRSMSSRNALHHGLSLPQEKEKDAATRAAINELSQLIASDYRNNQRFVDTEDAAAALLDLIRIREVRHQMLATMDLATATPKQLQRLLAIDRYESRARTRRRRASVRLEQDG